jgi:peptidyl-prolyl cis-trans isomerase D
MPAPVHVEDGPTLPACEAIPIIRRLSPPRPDNTMLQQMRRLPKWVAAVFFLPLAGTFIIWGIADVFRGSNDTSVATVGGTKIEGPIFSRDFSNARRSATQRNNGQLSQAKATEIGQKLLQQEISDTALDNVAQNLGLTTSDDEVSSMIRAIPGFQGPSGTFSELAFEQKIQQINYTPPAFVNEIRRELTREQLARAGASAAQLAPGYVRAVASYLNERRAVQYMILPPDAAGDVAPPSDDVLLAFMKAHANAFSTPEFRQLTFASIGVDDLASQVQVTDAQLRQAYDLRKDTYIVPERRDIQRINFPDEASAKAARAKIDAGAKFEDIATQRGISASDLNLTGIAQADLGAQGPATFALAEGAITQPVKGPFSWSLIRVMKITPGKTTTFEEAKPALQAELVKQLAGSKLEDVVNAFNDAHNSGDDIAVAAKKVGMKVTRVASTDAHGLAQDGSKADIPAGADFLDQVFKSDVGTEGDPFKAADGRYYVLKVEGVVPQKLKPLDAVRAQVTAAWTEDARRQKLAAKAAEIAKGAPADLGPVASQYHAVVLSSEALMRDKPTHDMSADLIDKIYSVPGGGTVSGMAADGKSYIVARVTGIYHIPLLNDPRYAQFAQVLGGQLSSDLQDSMGKAARNDQGVKINQQQVDRIVGGEGS